jgi:hypothetical protein
VNCDVGSAHEDAKYEAFTAYRGDRTMQLVWRLCEGCAATVRTSPGLIKIRTLRPERMAS